MLLHLLEAHETNIRKLLLQRNTISRNMLKDIQELLHERNPDYRAEHDEHSSNSSSDSSCESDDNQLLPKSADVRTKEDQDDIDRGNAAVFDCPIEGCKEEVHSERKHGSDWEVDLDRDGTTKNSPKIHGRYPHDGSNSIDLGSDGNGSGDEQNRDLSSEGSHLKPFDDYFNSDQTVYSNLYIQARQRNLESSPSYKDAATTKYETVYSHVMRASKDGYG